jgi:hypothetical protein
MSSADHRARAIAAARQHVRKRNQEDTGAERPYLRFKKPVTRRLVCGDFCLSRPAWLSIWNEPEIAARCGDESCTRAPVAAARS